jgi:hypothetical protein
MDMRQVGRTRYFAALRSLTAPARVENRKVDVDNLARLLADRFASIVPAGFHVEAAGGMLWYSAEEGRFPGQQGRYEVGQSGTHVRDNYGARGNTTEDQVVAVAQQALDEMQDYIDGATNDPWPGDRTVPRAHAERDAELHLWYGEPGEIFLACEPIPLASLIDPPD